MNFCTKCGAKLNGGSQFCSACGTPVSGSASRLNTTKNTVPYNPPHVVSYVPPQVSPHLNQQINIVVPPQMAQNVKGQTARLVVGIATVVLFFLLQVQSCAAMGMEAVANLFTDEALNSGALGYVVSFFFLIAGIVSIACRKSRGGTFAAGGIYLLCSFDLLAVDSAYFSDLPLYGILSLIFAIVLFISAARQKKTA